jgi:dephospho-CoA kinase
VRRVGLTGGIGSGKSEVARLLAAHGAVVVDADLLAREVVAPGSEGLAAVVEAFGPDVLTPDGGLDRAAVAARVFADPTARARLEAVVHPRVRALAARREAEAVAADPDAVVVHDVPLLVETGQQHAYDVVLVVDVPVQTQVDRLVQGRGMAPEEARARIAAQASREQRLAAADVVVDNSGSLESLARRVHDLWAQHLLSTPTDPGTPSPELPR